MKPQAGYKYSIMEDWIMASFIAVCLFLSVLLTGCAMSVGKITEYREDGTILKTTETTKNASTTQSIITVFGIRIKTLSPASTDAAPIEMDLGLARGAIQVVPIGESASIRTVGDIFGTPIDHSMVVNGSKDTERVK